MPAIAEEEHRQAMNHAAQSLSCTLNRMGHGKLPNAARIRLQHIYIWNAAELKVGQVTMATNLEDPCPATNVPTT